MVSVIAIPRTSGDADVNRLRILYELVTALSAARSLGDVYDAALSALLASTEADRAAILMFDEDGVIRFKASRGLSAEYQAAVTGHSPWKRGERNVAPIVTPDVEADAGLVDYREAFRQEEIRALVFVPLSLDAGVLGKFMLYYREPHEGQTEELEVAQVIAAHVVLATERHRAEAARSRTEQQLQAILDNSSTIIFLKDLQSRYILVNRRYEELFHLSQAQIAGKSDFDVFPSDIAARFVENDKQVLTSGRALAVEEHAPLDDGLHSYISVKFPIRNGDGQVAGLCGISTDITERKLLEAASQRLAAIVESSDDAIISKDLNGIIRSWNRAAERMFGYAADEVIGRPVSMLAPSDRQDEMPTILAQIRLGHVAHYDTRRQRKNGETIDVALTVSPVRDSAGQIVGASKIARDITERKHIERERAVLLDREQEARHTAELLNAVGPRLAAELDLEKLVQDVTDIATEAVGAEFGSFFHNLTNEKGESYMLYTLSGVARDAFAGYPMPRNTALFGPTFRGEGVVRCEDVQADPRYGKSEPHYGMPKGHLPVRSYLAAPVKSRSGEVLGGLFFGHSAPGKFQQRHAEILMGIAAQTGIAMDNARLFQQTQRVQDELKRSNQNLRTANRDLELFAYSASHDLQEPLRNISISAELIQQEFGGDLQGPAAGFLSNILKSSARMSTLMEDLLAYLRASKTEESPPVRIESNRVLAQVLEILGLNIADAGALVTSGDLPAVAMHEGRLAQVLQNLIANAIKYRGKEAPRVHISAEAREGWCTFSVSDNGMGIEPQYAQIIFGLFKRLHTTDEYSGSGIGLAICQRMVEQYGGRIWLEQSEPGRGSTFCFTAPIAG